MAGAAASFSGVQTCHSVHLCPVCMSKVLAVRASNVQLAADGLAAAGYVLALGTNTLRHFPRQPYGSLRDGQRGGLVALLHDAWKSAYGSAGRPWRRLRDSYGIVGYERAFEDTWGSESGFHLHWHVLWVLKVDPELTGDERRELFDRFRRAVAETWREAVLGAGGYEVSMKCDRPNCPCGGEGHGTDVRFIGSAEEGDTARYLYKDGDKGTAGIGMELTRSDFKDGRRWDRMSPLQLGDLAAEELLQLGQPGPLTEKYRERERGVYKVRKHYRSQSLNKLIKALEIEQDVRTEAEIAAEEGEGLRAVAVIPARTWYRHIAYHPGRRLALLKATEALGEDGVRVLIESWGLTWGQDVLSAPEEDSTDTEESTEPVAQELAAVPSQAEPEPIAVDSELEQTAAEFRRRRRALNAAREDEIADSMDRIRAAR
ncbi:hypothetical protein ACIG5E_39035 [Kitasatospora sp. NPDC053057]|uniref:hypothetical protein n=1 Tax=Kitasatospora sp. NPDC053057 TaxID=3364062 RepID=UPI0037C92AC3